MLRSLLKGGWDLKWDVWGCRDAKLLAWESVRAGRRLGWVLRGNLVPAGSDVLLPGELSQLPGGKEGQHQEPERPRWGCSSDVGPELEVCCCGCRKDELYSSQKGCGHKVFIKTGQSSDVCFPTPSRGRMQYVQHRGVQGFCFISGTLRGENRS